MSDAAFTGSIPQNYDRLLGPALFQPYAADLARRLASFSGDLLEVAAGTGIVTAALDAALPASVRITATDLNQAMLDHAAAKFASRRVSWRQADGQALPFDDASFDAVVCQFGVMFFPDRVQGFREAHRVLKEGGQYVFSVWDSLEDNPDASITHKTVAGMFPDDPPGFLARTPFGYCDRKRILADLKAGGFGDVTIEVVPSVGRATSAAEVAAGYCQGSPLAAEIAARRPGAEAEATAKVAEALTARYGDGPYDNPVQALVVTALR